MNSVRSKNLSLKYQSFTPPGCKDIKIVEFELMAKPQFLCIFLFRLGRKGGGRLGGNIEQVFRIPLF